MISVRQSGSPGGFATVLLVVLILLATPGWVSSSTSPVHERDLRPVLQQKLDAFREQAGFPGGTAALISAGERPVVVASGRRDRRHETAMQPTDRLLAGSIGKTFVAATALREVQLGSFALDEKIAEWFDDQAWVMRLPNGPDITFRQLLQHTAGLPDHLLQLRHALLEDPLRNWSSFELVELLLDQEPLFPAGARWSYSDANYVVLGHLLEVVTGSRYEELLQEAFLDPLSLPGIVPQSVVVPGLVQGHCRNGRSIGYPEFVLEDGVFVINPQFEWTGGGLATTASDLCRWTFLLWSGQLLQTQTMNWMLEGHPATTGANQFYGLGVQLRDSVHGPVRYHGGWFPGYMAETAFYPDLNLALTVQVNSDHHTSPSLFQVFLDDLASALRDAPPRREQRWGEDIEYLMNHILTHHKNPYTQTTPKQFELRRQQLIDSLAELSDAEIEVEVMSLVAAVGDSHTVVRPPDLFGAGRIPLSLHWFGTELRVIAAPAERADLIGGHVLGIEDFDLGEIMERLAEILCFGNAAWRKHSTPVPLVIPRLLQGAGLIEDAQEVLYRIRTREGDDREEVLQTLPLRSANLTGPVRSTLTARRPQWHFFEYQEDSALLYVQYNQCQTSAEQPLEVFVEQILDCIGQNEIRGVVYDLQYNSGGNSLLGTLMFGRIHAALSRAARKNIFGIIGRRNFSSGTLNALELRQAYKAPLIGEATGGALNHFGEIKTFNLPHSRIGGQYSTKLFQKVDGPGLTLTPDHVVELTFDQFAAQEDPCWEKVLELLEKRSP
jgi:D-alanyl-D-alanine carboxypeptidase